MKDHTPAPEVTTSGALERFSFGTRQSDFPALFKLLTSSLYSDKIAAFVRELTSNAWDIHRKHQVSVPFRITAPTHLNPTWIIRDFGPGMTHEEVRTYVANVGASTKRDSDTEIGHYGLGVKSPFAYTSAFSVVSRNGGKKRVYHATLGTSETGDVQLVFEGETDEPSGLEVSVPVRLHDIYKVTEATKRFLEFVEPKPEVNFDHDWSIPSDTRILPSFRWRPGAPRLHAVMGCVSYPIDYNVGKSWPFGGDSTIFFDIGEIDIPPSRETVEWTERSLAAFTARVDRAKAEHDTWLDSQLASCKSGWERRNTRRRLAFDRKPERIDLDYGVVSSAPPQAGHSVPVAQSVEGTDFGLNEEGTVPDRVPFHIAILQRSGRGFSRQDRRRLNEDEFTELVLVDVPKFTSRVRASTYLICPNFPSGTGANFSVDKTKQAQWNVVQAAIQAALPEWLARHRLDGVPIRRASEFPIPMRVREKAEPFLKFRPGVTRDYRVSEIPQGAMCVLKSRGQYLDLKGGHFDATADYELLQTEAQRRGEEAPWIYGIPANKSKRLLDRRPDLLDLHDGAEKVRRTFETEVTKRQMAFLAAFPWPLSVAWVRLLDRIARSGPLRRSPLGRVAQLHRIREMATFNKRWFWARTLVKDLERQDAIAPLRTRHPLLNYLDLSALMSGCKAGDERAVKTLEFVKAHILEQELKLAERERIERQIIEQERKVESEQHSAQEAQSQEEAA